ncbi:MAG: hypothetical protein GY768_24100 [Planctomycetaceae bacterium]|nr:hypothetical protein [Planctomycetaceae bacterium]
MKNFRTEINRPGHWLRRIIVTTALIGTLAATEQANAQFGHSDVDFAQEGNRLITNKRVYEAYFPTFGISKYYSSNPGFAAEVDGLGTIGSRQEVVYDVLDRLFFWDGVQFDSPDEEVQIRVENNPPGSGSTFINGASGVQRGTLDPPANRIGAASNAGEFHSHVSYYFEAGEDDPPVGAYGLKIAVSTTDTDEIDDSEPIFMVFNLGLDSSTFEESLSVYEGILDTPGIVGDFDSSGILDAVDIDLLTDAILGNSTDLKFDVNFDGGVDYGDRREWVEVLRGTYFGDTNLDGEFSSTDLVAVFQLGEYEDGIAANSTWSAGDWNGDREVDSADLVIAFQAGGYEQGPRPSLAVPEPTGLHSLLLIAMAILTNVRHRRIKRSL